MPAGSINRRSVLQGAGLALLSPGLIHRASAQRQQVVRLVYPFAAGGGGDAVARIVADQMSAGLSVPVIVENRTGAAGRMGAKSVSSAEPDGTTLLIVPNPPVSIYPHSYQSLDYDPVRDFAPISLIATFDVALAVSPQMNIKTIAELISWAKQNPTKASYGSPGAGGLGHFFAVMFAMSAGVDFLHVGYRGSSTAVNDLIGGQIPMVVVTLGDIIEQHKAGHAHILAVSGGQRSPLLPNVPTFKESGVTAEGQGWFALYAPAKTPAETIDRINKVLATRLATPEVRDRLLKLNVVPQTSTPAQLAELQSDDSRRWAPVVKASGFTSQQ